MNAPRSHFEWRNRLLSQHRESFEETDAPSLDDVGWEQLERKQWLEAAQAFDPGATLMEELLVRLIGETATNSALRLEWEGLLRPIQDAVAAAADGNVNLELSGFSKGSSVLHFRAVKREPVEFLADDDVPMRETPLAAPVRRFIEFVDAVEHEEDVRMYSNSPMLSGVAKLSEELERLGLVADFRFYARSGDLRRATLSERGLDYMKSLSEAEEFTTQIFVSGRVTELRESGHAKVKRGTTRNATAFDVQFDSQSLTDMRLVLGQYVNWRVSMVSTKDKLGRLRSTRYEFDGDSGLHQEDAFQLDEKDAWNVRIAAQEGRTELWRNKDEVVLPDEDVSPDEDAPR
ncbi:MULTISPECIES: hypothetical protein [Paenarthrobacter]|uniref:hypothetical protein n=1 Tax=Paenarthrobacter TaxID=1742992 RepID=UPI00074D45E8|nr:hypothetical protein [Paenarthrobacter ureafaciens]AMB39656.1 hypothetical protein AUT26_05090 [Arthrobacter sp. ATCC 21022]KUR65337.1 hypothetical protein JM67_05690 [Arthrobacter sp. ATCC 21022]RWW95887.1 hypothetical protein AUR_15610 [Paenarthrobacter ureafaciens]